MASLLIDWIQSIVAANENHCIRRETGPAKKVGPILIYYIYRKRPFGMPSERSPR